MLKTVFLPSGQYPVNAALQSLEVTVGFYKASQPLVSSSSVSPSHKPFFVARSFIEAVPQIGEIYTLPLPQPALSFQRSPFILQETQVVAVEQQSHSQAYAVMVNYTEHQGLSDKQLYEQIQMPVTARHSDLGHLTGKLFAIDPFRNLAGIQNEMFAALLSQVQDDSFSHQMRQPPSTIWVDASTVRSVDSIPTIAPEIMSQAATRYQSEQLQHYWVLGYQDAVQGHLLLNPITGRSLCGTEEFDAYKAGFLWAEGQEQEELCILLSLIRSMSFRQSQAKNLGPASVSLKDLIAVTNQTAQTLKVQLQLLLQQGAIAVSEEGGLVCREVDAMTRPYVPIDERHYLYHVWKELTVGMLF